jgi:multidrug efflux system membrane fusion protein
MNHASLPACLVAIAGALASACSQPAAASEPSPIPVKVERVAARDALGTNRYSGSLEPAVRVELAFRVGGYVSELAEIATPSGPRPLDKGDVVKKGSVLARVRASEYSEKVKTASAQVGEAHAEQVLATQELERAERLFVGKAITRAEYDAKVARAESMKAELEAARARAGEAAVALGDTVLRAPFDGVVLARQGEIGTLVSPGQAVLVVADTRTMKAVFGAPQVLVEELALGSPVSVFVGPESEARTPDRLLEARITRIAPAADNNGRVFSVEAALPNQDGRLRAGSVVSVRVPEPLHGQDELVVPLRSVVRSPRDAHGFSAFVLDGDADRARARLANLELGEVVGNGVTVVHGLARGDRVVTVGATLLTDGADAVVIR